MLVLASASPARRRLLEQAAIPHRVRVSGLDESTIREPDPLQLVQRLAAAKAQAVLAADDSAQAGGGEAEPVLGCDSVLVVDGEVYGKPRDREEAIGRWLPPRVAVVSTRVAFAAVDRPAIEAYVDSGEPLECAGGFALEGRGGLLVERIEGCFSNVIGLSLPLLRLWLSCPPPGTAR